MDYSFTPEEREFAAVVERFGRERLVPNWSQAADDGNIFLQASWDAMGEMGLLGLPYPEEYGGSGASAFCFSSVG